MPGKPARHLFWVGFSGFRVQASGFGLAASGFSLKNEQPEDSVLNQPRVLIALNLNFLRQPERSSRELKAES
jgi:hypothetical protein